MKNKKNKGINQKILSFYLYISSLRLRTKPSARKQMNISLFENTLYWTWNWGERRNRQAMKEGGKYRVALPERSFINITIFQFAYFMFFVSLVLHTFSNETIIMLYEIGGRFTITPFGFIFAFMFLIHSECIYTEKKYNALKAKYAQMTDAQKQEAKKTNRIFCLVSILTATATVILWSLYADKVKEVVRLVE